MMSRDGVEEWEEKERKGREICWQGKCGCEARDGERKRDQERERDR